MTIRITIIIKYDVKIQDMTLEVVRHNHLISRWPQCLGRNQIKHYRIQTHHFKATIDYAWSPKWSSFNTSQSVRLIWIKLFYKSAILTRTLASISVFPVSLIYFIYNPFSWYLSVWNGIFYNSWLKQLSAAKLLDNITSLAHWQLVLN